MNEIQEGTYDDFYIASRGEAEQQIDVAKEVVTLARQFVSNLNGSVAK